MNLLKLIWKNLLKIILIGNLAFSILLTFGLSWTCFGIWTDRGGYNYNFYIYYDLSKTEILIQYFFILITFSALALFQFLTLRKGDNQRIIQILVISVLLLLLLNTYDTYLYCRYVPKG